MPPNTPHAAPFIPVTPAADSATHVGAAVAPLMVHTPSHSSFAPRGPSGSHGKPKVSTVQLPTMASSVLPTGSVPSGSPESPAEQETNQPGRESGKRPSQSAHVRFSSQRLPTPNG